MRGPQGAADTIHSLKRAPLMRVEPASITIAEIERQVEALRANWPEGAQLRELVMLFAILKEGSSAIKLKWFTGYDDHFIRLIVEELRQHGKLFTGTLTAQFILSQLPGSENLIEVITGVRPVKPAIQPASVPAPASRPPIQKENLMSSKPTDDRPVRSVEGDNSPDNQCPRDAQCTKPAKHRGKCATGKTARVTRTKPAVKAVGHAPKPESVPPVKSAATALASMFHFTVFCKMDGEEYRAEGASRTKLQSALATIDRILGGAN